MSRDTCSEIMAEVPRLLPTITENMVCALDNDYVSTGCAGDSGG